MIGLLYTIAIIFLTLLFNIKYYYGFLILVFGLLLFRNSLGMKSKIFGYFFLFQKRIESSAPLNILSSSIYILFYFNKELGTIDVEKAVSILVLNIILYYWLYDGLPTKIKRLSYGCGQTKELEQLQLAPQYIL